MIPEGKWKVKACDWMFGTASTGTRQIGVDLRILEGPAAGSHATWFGYFSDKAWELAVRSLRALGWNGSDLSDMSGLGSADAYAVIEHEQDDQGEIRARVRWINAEGGVAMANRMDPGALKNFAAEMRGKILAMDQGQAQPRTAAPSQRPTAPAGRPAATHVMPDNKDDIPF